MLLRESGALEGENFDARSITNQVQPSGVPYGEALLAFAEACVGGEAEAIAMTRSALQTQMGAASVVDAAAIIGNFERMDRIADGTGIPLDTPVAAMTADLREDLGLNEFGSAANTPAVGRFLAGMGRLMRPIMRRLAPTLFRQ